MCVMDVGVAMVNLTKEFGPVVLPPAAPYVPAPSIAVGSTFPPAVALLYLSMLVDSLCSGSLSMKRNGMSDALRDVAPRAGILAPRFVPGGM